jgi:hypothetical protein
MAQSFDSRFDIEYDGELPDSVDTAALDRMETVAYALDESVEIPGTDYSVGVDPILGALPVAGDVVSAAFSLYIVAESAYLGVSYTTLLGMLANITVDTVGGSVPYVGSVFDAVWKANKRNVGLVLRDLAETVEDATGEDSGGDGESEAVDIPVVAEF